jgi:hypothetical protein
MSKSHTHSKHAGSHHDNHLPVTSGHHMHADQPALSHKAEVHNLHANHGNSGQTAYLTHTGARQKNNSSAQDFASNMIEANKRHSDTILRAMEAATSGINEAFQALAHYMQNMTELSAAAFQAAASANTLQEITKIQHTYAKTSMEILHEHGARITQTAFQTANDAAKPFQEHVAESMQKLNQQAAA